MTDTLRERVARAILAADKFLVESGHHHWEYKSESQRNHYLAEADAAIALVLEEAARVAQGNEASATEYYRGRVHAAAAIRALKEKP